MARSDHIFSCRGLAVHVVDEPAHNPSGTTEAASRPVAAAGGSVVLIQLVDYRKLSVARQLDDHLPCSQCTDLGIPQALPFFESCRIFWQRSIRDAAVPAVLDLSAAFEILDNLVPH